MMLECTDLTVLRTILYCLSDDMFLGVSSKNWLEQALCYSRLKETLHSYVEEYNDLMLVFNMDEFMSSIIMSLYDQDIFLRKFLF